MHPYFTEKPLPKSPDMMPTFPSRTDMQQRSSQKTSREAQQQATKQQLLSALSKASRPGGIIPNRVIPPAENLKKKIAASFADDDLMDVE